MAININNICVVVKVTCRGLWTSNYYTIAEFKRWMEIHAHLGEIKLVLGEPAYYNSWGTQYKLYAYERAY